MSLYCIVFIHIYSASHSLSLSEGLPTTAIDTVSEYNAEALQAIAGKGLAQGPYVAARAGFEPTTLRSNGVVSTNAPPCPTWWRIITVANTERKTHTSVVHVLSNSTSKIVAPTCENIFKQKLNNIKLHWRVQYRPQRNQ